MVKGVRGIDPFHRRTQGALRMLGPIVLCLGVILTAVGLISFFSAFGTFEPPRYFFAAIIGLPTIGIGLVLTRLGYLGAFFRYVSAEVSPVATDTFNAMSEEASKGMEAMARAASRGFSTGLGRQRFPKEQTLDCPHCQAANTGNAQFCNQCGTSLVSRACSHCSAELLPRSQFCNQCGKAVG